MGLVACGVLVGRYMHAPIQPPYTTPLLHTPFLRGALSRGPL